MGLLTGKRALVCGSTQGIGKAVAENFAVSGAEVILLARDQAALKVLAGCLERCANQKHTYIVSDHSKPEALQQILADRLPAMGPIHILLNNTGGPPGGPIRAAGTDELLEAFSKHLICNQILVKAVLKGMKQEGFGRIINIISTSVKQPLPGLGVSNTVRGAVASWSKTLAGELGPFGITVNNILPGYTETARLTSIIANKANELNKTAVEVAQELKSTIPLGRFARPEEIADAVEFLASNRAAYISGINLPVDGGRLNCL